MVDMGLLAHIGAHGEPPLGLNYHAEMFFTKQGGLSNYEVRFFLLVSFSCFHPVYILVKVLRAATISGAITLSMNSSLGSLSRGKLADFLVYLPGVDLLDDHILHTLNLRYVARGGRLWDANTMEEAWPLKGKKQQMPPFNAE
jgi:hypothetical protein